MGTLEEALLPAPAPHRADAFIEWLQTQEGRQDAIGALAGCVNRAAGAVSTLDELRLELLGRDPRRLGDVHRALQEFHTAFIRSRAGAAVPRQYSIQLPDGRRIERLLTDGNFDVFTYELRRLHYDGEELAVYDEVGRTKAWVTATGW
ncbi:hypothetical protein LVJ94_49290 [Pendulispora rubella]|uniref:Uncharacterized protein n=1 Tax=Pendulispora rubella TaxID=2741070 RepID=A0ABZ2L6R3_9BACT